MKEEIIYLRSMVSPLDILQVSRILQQCGVKVKEVEIGAAAFINDENIPIQLVKEALERKGYQLTTKLDLHFLSQLKNLVELYLEQGQQLMGSLLLSEYLETEMGLKYSQISKRYSRLEGHTLESYCIGRKIEKIKNLLRRTDLETPEIAIRLRYSSKAYMARQFKEQTGQSIKDFRKGSGFMLATG